MMFSFDRLCGHGATRPLVQVGVGLLLAIVILARPAAGQEVRAVVSEDSVRVGEPFTLSLVVIHRDRASVTFPPAEADDVFGDVEMLDRTSVTTRYQGSDEEVRIDSVAYEATTFAIDTAHVPAVPVQLVTDADTVRAASDPIQIPIRSALPSNPEGLRGLAPLASFPRAYWPWVALGGAVLVLLAGLVYYWRRRRATTEPAPAPEPSGPPHEAARRRLQVLENTTDWNDPEALENFFVELSATMRLYVARRLGIATLERTTRELISALRAETPLPAAAIDATRDVLEQADLVKFADRRPVARDGRTALQQARTAIDDIEQALQRREVRIRELEN